MDKKIIDQIELLKGQMIDDIKKVLRFDTVKQEEKPNAPFGQGCADCLDFVLDMCQKDGWQTKNVDYYAGHADFGEGEEICGVLGHLDVVPADEDSWIYPPFSATEDDGKIYARGAMDDKTPMISVFYAVKALRNAGYKFNKKVRLIFGCDEESGMNCIKHYFSIVPPPDFAFSPDADFPLINCEKGIVCLFVDCGEVDERLTFLEAGKRSNVVPDKCVAVFDGEKIETTGLSAHASQPEKGKNATHEMFELLGKKGCKTCQSVFDALCDFTGAKCNCNLSDKQSGDLTMNIGVVRVEGGRLQVVIDIRHPASMTCESVIEHFNKNLSQFTITTSRASQPLYVPEDSQLVQKLLAAYSSATGQKAYPIAIGGGTYSRSMKNCVAFGPEFPNEKAAIHQPNEYVKIDWIERMTAVYAEAIRMLCCE